MGKGGANSKGSGALVSFINFWPQNDTIFISS